MNGLLMHRRESTEYVQPAHIIAQARKAKRNRQIEEAKRATPAALAAPVRAAPPANFRQMIEAATGGMFKERQLTMGGKTAEQRAAARAELKRLATDLGEPAL